MRMTRLRNRENKILKCVALYEQMLYICPSKGLFIFNTLPVYGKRMCVILFVERVTR